MTQPARRNESNSLSRLRAAARTLFVRDGYDKARPQDIAREAGVANGTFYLHFRDKREAFQDFAEQAQHELYARFGDRLDGVDDPRARWRVILRAICEFAEANPGLLSAAFLDPLFVAPDDPEAWRQYDRLGHLVRLAVGDDEIAERLAADYDIRLISHALCGFLSRGMLYAARTDMDRDALIDELSGFIDRALVLDPAPASEQKRRRE